MNQDYYRKLISGQVSTPTTTFLRFLLKAASIFYSIAITLRNFLYSRGWLKTASIDATVISIGNVTVGGTGKTPLVIWLCNLLREKDIPCAILTRGYKAHRASRLTRNTLKDEPALLATNCPNAKVVVNPDRVAGAIEAVEKYDAKVLIMDDGFQHRRLARDLDIVTIDATLPFGYGQVLPAGLLRESPSALKRADAVVITRCDKVAEYKLSRLEKQLQQINPDITIARSVHEPVCAKALNNKEIGLEEIRGKKVFAFCGIGNPDAFLGTIKKLGAVVVGSKVYNDHHNYTEDDIADIRNQAEELGTDLILSTQKDWTKTALLLSAGKEVIFAYLAIELRFVAGEVKLKQLIENTLTGKILES